MYARQVKDQTLTFGVSGKLWENSLVMFDQETGSLWSHLLGQSMEGPLKGESLEVVPSTMTDWKTWRDRYPETTLVDMERSAAHYTRGVHDLHGGLMIGLVTEESTRVWPFSSLIAHGLANDRVGDVPVVVTFDPASFTAMVFDRRVDDSELKFVLRDGQLFDEETGSQWDPITGRAVDGPKQGRQLVLLPGLVSDGAVFSVYHPESTTWIPELSPSVEPVPGVDSEPLPGTEPLPGKDTDRQRKGAETPGVRPAPDR